MRPRIAVVNSSSFGKVFPLHLARLKRIGSVRRIETGARAHGSALARRIGPAEAVIASVQPVYDEEFFRANRTVALVARHGIGINNVDVRAATRHGVMLTRVEGIVERAAMAEHTLALMLAVVRKRAPAHAAVAAGKWAHRRRFVGVELKGREVGLIGFGNVGAAVGRILARGFGARVLAYDPGVSAARMRRAGARPVSLAALLSRSSVISLHASLNSTSRGILGAAALRRTRPGTVLVNTARGELVDERAVARALGTGRLAGYGADVVSMEPAGRGHVLLRSPNVILVPHIGAYTVESLGAMGEKMVADVTAVFGLRRAPAGLVNPEVLRGRSLRARLRG